MVGGVNFPVGDAQCAADGNCSGPELDGAVSALFDTPQSKMGFSVAFGTTFEIQFFKSGGTLLDSMIIDNPQTAFGDFAFQTASGQEEIAGFSLTTTDLSGILYNDLIVERRYALLGQSYFKDTSQFQTGDVTLVLSSNMPTTENLWEIAARYHEKLLPMVNDFPNWSDLEDHDSDIDGDEEEYNLSWDPVNSDDEIDELVDR